MTTTVTQEPMLEKDTINLFNVGALMNLRVKMWSGRKMLTRTDLIKVGYDPDHLPADIVNLGRKSLVPKAELQNLTRIEQQARKGLERFSVPFGIANSHFVPIKMLPTIVQQLEGLKEEFFTRVDSFITRFEDLKAKVAAQHPVFWTKCLQGNYPSNPQALRQYFHFEWFIFKIAGMDAIQQSSVEEMVAQQQVTDEKQLELRTQMKSQIGEFVGEYVGVMRGEVIRFCDLVTSRINGKPFGDETEAKRLTPKSLSCFRKYIDRFHNMNVFGDTEIEKMLREFKEQFLDDFSSPTDFEGASVKTGITTALSALREKARAEGDSGSKFIGGLKRKVVLD